jgi:uncharacterized membrane protein (Fun14 family)
MDNATATNTIQEVLKQYGFDVGYGFFVGWVIGFTVKKFFKFFAFAFGVYLLTLIWLDHTGIITIHWDYFGKIIEHGQQEFQNWIQNLFKAVPFSASFAIGFAVGFKMG